MGFPYTEVSPVLRSLQSSPVSVPLYNNLWLTSVSPCVGFVAQGQFTRLGIA